MPLSPPMTHTLSVRCQNCGSPLQVSDSIRFVTCGYCHSELQVVRDASTIHTEVLQKIEKNTATTVSQLKVIELQNEIERLDREWEMWKQQNLSRDKSGQISEPVIIASPKTVTLVISIAVLIACGIMIANRTSIAALLIPVVFGAVFLFVALGDIHYAESFLRAQGSYDSERDRLLIALEQAREESRSKRQA